MRVLVTGGAGFAGSHLIQHFLDKTDWHIISLDSYRHKGDDLRHVQNPRVTHFAHDCATPISYRLSAKIGDIDFIINLASESHVDRSIEDPVPFIENNVKLAAFMCEYAKAQKSLKAFVQVSTDEVYGAAPDGVDHKEWAPILPSNPYSASKAAQESICISYWRTFGLPLIITNTMNMYGEMQDAEKFIPLCISKVIKDEKIQIHGSDSYIGKRKYLHAKNHADAILFLIQSTVPTKYIDSGHVTYPDRYNIAGDIELNNLQVAGMISASLNKELNYEMVDFHAARPGHDRRYSLDGSKITALGWMPPIDFYSGLYSVIDWSVKNKEWL